MSHYHRAPSTGTPRSGRALDRAQFASYAADQISSATALLGRHAADTPPGCGCGRPAPCPQRLSLTATVEHYRGQLALLDATVVLPVIVPATVSGPGSRWRRLLGGWR